MKKIFFLTLLGMALLAAKPDSGFGDVGRDLALITRGVGKTVGTAVAVPINLVGRAATLNPFNMVGGVLSGTARLMKNTISGGTDIARGGAPYAKYAVFA